MPAASVTAAVTPTETGVTVAARAYSVVLVAEGGTLSARTAAGDGNPEAGSLAWDAAGLNSTGRMETVGADTWLELNLPGGGTGWVNRKYLTEFIASADFCVDGRAVSLFESLYAGRQLQRRPDPHLDRQPGPRIDRHLHP